MRHFDLVCIHVDEPQVLEAERRTADRGLLHPRVLDRGRLLGQPLDGALPPIRQGLGDGRADGSSSACGRSEKAISRRSSSDPV